MKLFDSDSSGNITGRVTVPPWRNELPGDGRMAGKLRLIAASREDKWVSGRRVIVNDGMLDRGRDITEKLREAAARQDV
jgi:hypothetical protein